MPYHLVHAHELATETEKFEDAGEVVVEAILSWTGTHVHIWTETRPARPLKFEMRREVQA